MKVKNIGVITGGAQSQRSVNVAHAKDIGEALAADFKVHYYDLSVQADLDRIIHDRREGKLDMVFNNAAGKKGGDGTVEGVLEVFGIPFVGSDALATAVAFDKKTAKGLAKKASIPVVPGIVVYRYQFEESLEDTADYIENNLIYPLIIKASRGSDSIGISLVNQRSEIGPALEKVFKEDDAAIIEKYIVRETEITCMVFGNHGQLEAFEPVENFYTGKFLNAKAKIERRVPTINKRVLNRIKLLSTRIHQEVGCLDYSRSDFLVDASNQVYFLEINGHAGLGKESPTAFAAKQTKGWSHAQLIKEILNLAVKRYKL